MDYKEPKEPKVKVKTSKKEEPAEPTEPVKKIEKKEIPTTRQKGHPDAVAHMAKLRSLRKSKAPKELKA